MGSSLCLVMTNQSGDRCTAEPTQNRVGTRWEPGESTQEDELSVKLVQHLLSFIIFCPAVCLQTRPSHAALHRAPPTAAKMSHLKKLFDMVFTQRGVFRRCRTSSSVCGPNRLFLMYLPVFCSSLVFASQRCVFLPV